MFYCTSDDDSPAEAREIAAVVARLLAANLEAGEDAKRLKQILKVDRDELCRKQNRC